MEKKKAEYSLLYREEGREIMKTAGGSLDPRLDRVDEIVEYAREAGMKKIGIANCISFEKEAQKLEEYLQKKGFSTERANCKLGRVPFAEIVPGYKGISCNPAGQAIVMNEGRTELNLVLGLCLGHDMVFDMNAESPSTTLFVKDRKYKHHTLNKFNE